VQVIKGRYTIEKRLRDVLEGRYKSTIAQMKKKTDKQRAARNVRPRPSVLPRAESRTQGMRKTIQRRTISPALRQRKLEELAKKKKSIIAEVDASEDAKVKKAQTALKEASDRGDVQQAKVLKAKMETTEHNAKKAKKGVRRRFESEAFMRKEVKPLANGDLYAIEDYDDVIFVVINSESDFFRSMYSRAAQHSNEQDLLDLMIFAIAYAEADRSNSEEMDQFWQQTRSTVSSLSHIFVSMLNHVDPVDEAPASQDEAEEVEEEPESHVQLSLTDSFGGSP
jgi:enoyl-[acyl-carrier-protein] reductase (NADH)